MNKKYFCSLIIFSVLVFSALASADMGMVAWPPEIQLDQSAQNVIVAWDGQEEVMILSTDIKGSGSATTLRILPLPSEPSEITDGSFASFERLIEIINDKTGAWDYKALGEGTADGQALPGVEIVFQEQVGAHDLTIVKVNSLTVFLNWIKGFVERKGFQEKEFSNEFKNGIENYLQKDIKYFVFDVVETGSNEESIQPLVYRFQSGFLYYPILISGISDISESQAEINLL